MKASRFQPGVPERLGLNQVQYEGQWGDTTASMYIGPLVLTVVIENEHQAVKLLGPDTQEDPTNSRLLLGRGTSHIDGRTGFKERELIEVARLRGDDIVVGRGMLTEALRRHDQPIDVRAFERELGYVSGEHVRLTVPPSARQTSIRGGAIVVEDLHSTNGTYRIR